MTDPIRLTFDDAQARAMFARLSSARALAPFMRDAGELLTETTQARFRTGTAPNGSAWKALADGSGRTPLLKSGNMRDRITPHKGAHGLTAAQRAHAAQLCAGISLPIPEPRTAPAPTLAAPPVITNCDNAGCWDTNGVRYNRGAGDTHFPSTGGPACQLINGQMICP